MATSKVLTGDRDEESVAQEVGGSLKKNLDFSYWRDEWKALVVVVLGFLVCFAIPVGWGRFDRSVMEALYLVKWYAHEHVLMCLIPAFFIAGAIGVFLCQEGVMKYLGPAAPKYICYPVASVSGSVLAVCSCTVLPLFAGMRNGKRAGACVIAGRPGSN